MSEVTSSGPSSEGTIRLTTLGSPGVHIETPGGATRAFGPGKPVALMAYLACSANRSASREHLIDMLWSDQPLSQARHALSQTIWHIRQKLGDGALATDNLDVSLQGRVYCDRDHLVGRIAARDSKGIIESYAGDFLVGFAAPGGAEFEQWADIERSRLRTAFIRATEEVVRTASVNGRDRWALELARRARDAAPWREEGWRFLIETHLRAGDTIGAALEAEALQCTFEREGRELRPATTEVIESISANGSQETGPQQPNLLTQLVGREEEFSGILGAWNAARGGSFVHVHITAPAGHGKTRLIADVCRRLRFDGAAVALVSGNRGGRSLPYALASDLAAALCGLPGATGVATDAAGALRALNPALCARFDAEPDRSSGEEALRRRALAVGDLIDAVADQQPVALFIDDLHWADRFSLRLLQALLGRHNEVAAMVVTASRPDSASHLEVEPLIGYELRPLSADDIGELLAGLARMESDRQSELAERIRTATAGSPLLVLETVQLALEKGALELEDGRWSIPDIVQLNHLLGSGSALSARIEALTPMQRRILLVLALAGTPLAQLLISSAATSTDSTTPADLGELEQHGFIKRVGDQWSTGHDEIAERAIELAGKEDVRGANLLLGRGLAALADGDEQVVLRAGRHLFAAGGHGDLAQLYRRFVVRSRGNGDPRPLRLLARDIAGPACEEAEATFLVRSLPLRYRVGLHTPHRVALALTLLVTLGGLGGWGLLPNNTEPPLGGGYLALAWKRGTTLDSVTALSVNSEFRSRPIPPDALPDLVRQGFRESLMNPGGSVALFPCTDRHHDPVVVCAFDRHSGDTTVVGSFESDALPLDWFPAGNAILMKGGHFPAAGRWAGALLVVDLDEGSVDTVAFGETDYTFARLAHSGRRLVAEYDDGIRSGARLMDVEGHLLGEVAWCRGDAAWSPDDSLLACREVDGGEIVIGNPLTGALLGSAFIDGSRLSQLLWSPDGRFLAVAAVGETTTIQIVNRANPGAPILLGDFPGSINLLGWLPDTPTPPVVGLAVSPDSAVATPGQELEFRVRSVSANGPSYATVPVEWTLSDSSVARIGSGGQLIADRAGTTTVYARYGLHLVDSTTVSVTGSEQVVLLEENFDNGLTPANWKTYGAPESRIEQGRGRNGSAAFFNNGDNSHESGIASRIALDPTRGLTVEYWINVELTASLWQETSVSFRGVPADSFHPGPGTPVKGTEIGVVQAIAPSLDHPDRIPRVNLRTDLGSSVETTSLGDGRWHRLRLVLYPSGEVRWFGDGIELTAPGRTNLVRAGFVTLAIAGRSVGTMALVDDVVVWEGVVLDPSAPPVPH